jgi:hypothetical protein
MGRDNQQVTVTKIAWLAGIWDGEGTFSIIKLHKHPGRINLAAKATMENTDTALVTECCKVLSSLGVQYFICYRKRKTDKHKDAYTFSIIKYEDLKRFCTILSPYLISKKSRALLMKRFVESRLAAMKKHGQDHRNMGFSKKEHLLADKMHELNIFGKTDTSTTLREKFVQQRASQKRYLDKTKIKSDLHGDMQR